MGTKLIIDTDPGVDDAFAIALAATSTDVELLGVTTVFGNVPLVTTTANARRLLQLCDRTDVPVAAGASRPFVHQASRRLSGIHGSDGLSGQAGSLPEATRPLHEGDAVSLLVSLLEAADEPVTIVPIGPLTNIAALLAAHPGVRSKISRIVLMGGGVARGNSTAVAEFNIWADPEAARRVIAEDDVPCVLVPLDLTHQCAVDSVWLSELASSGPLGRTLEAFTPEYRAHYQQVLGYDGMVVHDAVAVAEAIRPGLLRTETYPVHVDTSSGPARGMTLVDRRAVPIEAVGRPVDVAVDTDVDELRNLVLSRLAGGC
ncbi:nucleoside hydrolase [Amycolatopsis jiangsuensis]|nr:nucleoside hydrolase [Amycolatopsis jiangsuensis]